MNTLDTEINLNQQFLGAEHTNRTADTNERNEKRTNKKNRRDTKCVMCILRKAMASFAGSRDFAALRRHDSTSRRRREDEKKMNFCDTFESRSFTTIARTVQEFN